MNWYVWKWCHSKNELEAMIEESIDYINILHKRIEDLKNNRTWNFW